MGLLNKALTRLGYTKDILPLSYYDALAAKAMGENVPDFLIQTANNERWNIPDMTLADNQMKTYQASSWVADAVGHVSRYAATIELEVFRLDGEDKTEIPNHPFELLLKRPNPVMSGFQLKAATFGNLLLAGNAYWFLNRLSENSPIMEIFLLPANRIEVVPGSQAGMIAGYMWDAGNGEKVPLEPWEIAHFSEFHPRNMFVGLSRIESIGKEIEKDSKAALYDLNFYSNDNAKPEGVLSIKGNMPEKEFDKLKQRIERKHGGVKRSMAIVQGPETIDYVQMALNYADMDFIANRGFTRDQIYNHIAPGLASVLSVNSTEANSRTGKATLMEFGIYPMNVSMQETITNSILPAYGDNLIAEFEDVRLSDKAMELSEMMEFAKTHTVDEVRQEYYNDDSIGDERGNMLIAQIGQNDVSVNLSGDVRQVNQQGQPSGTTETGDATEEPAQETAGQMKADLKKWKSAATKRMKAGRNIKEFESRYIPLSLKAAIEGALEEAETHHDALGIFADALTWEGYP